MPSGRSDFDIASPPRKVRPVLVEITNVKQEAGAGRRRWFESDGLELVVWLGPDDHVIGFQLCYDLGRGEHALTWRAGDGCSHAAIDSGETSPLRNESPLLVPVGPVPMRELAQLFHEHSATLEPELRRLVLTELPKTA